MNGEKIEQEGREDRKHQSDGDEKCKCICPFFDGLSSLFAVGVVIDRYGDDKNAEEKDKPHSKPRIEHVPYLLLRFVSGKQTAERVTTLPPLTRSPSPDKGRRSFFGSPCQG